MQAIQYFMQMGYMNVWQICMQPRKLEIAKIYLHMYYQNIHKEEHEVTFTCHRTG